jgi:RNA polymerase sigma-70 factor (ECF subfamily)
MRSISFEPRPASTHDEVDADALDRLRRGDNPAFDALVARYGGRIYGFASRMCRSGEDARDVLQDTLLGAARTIGGFRAESRLSTWLLRIAANACLKMRRRRRRLDPDRLLSLDAALPEGGRVALLVADIDTPERRFLRESLRAALERAIATLSSSYRAVVILRDVEGLSAEETAAALGLSVPAVKSRLHRGRTLLRQALLHDGGPAPEPFLRNLDQSG